MKRFASFASLASLVFLAAGCTPHYRKALELYRRNEPTPFHKKTLEWTAAAERATSATLVSAQGGAPAPGAVETGRQGDEDEVFLRLASEFVGVAPDSLARRLKPFRDVDEREDRLKRRLDPWEFDLAVLLFNPEIKAARDRWKAALRQFDQSEYLENLVAQYRTFTRYLSIEAGENVETGDMIHTQMMQSYFPYPSSMALKGEMIRQMVRMAELDWQRAMREAVVQADAEFYEYQFDGRAEGTVRENITLVENLLSVIEDRYRAGAASQADLLKQQTELARQRNMLQDISAKRTASLARLNALIHRKPTAPLGPPAEDDAVDTAPSFAGLLKTALASRQEILKQQAMIAREDVAIRMGEAMSRPLASRGYSNFERGMMPEASAGESMPSFGLQAKTVDRPAFAQVESYLAESRERLAAERKMLEQETAQTGAEAESMIQDLDVARREVDLVRDIVLPQSRSAYETTLSAYSSNRSSFLDLLDAERMLVDSSLELHEARRTLNQALARVPNVAGRFVRSGIAPAGQESPGPPEAERDGRESR
ncbi:MAG: TolC family protein [Candidatus Sumerlaeota bacterium]|nr:TolC family protein [Candidatus Sumerlaeota bacterium]